MIADEIPNLLLNKRYHGHHVCRRSKAHRVGVVEVWSPGDGSEPTDPACRISYQLRFPRDHIPSSRCLEAMRRLCNIERWDR